MFSRRGGRPVLPIRNSREGPPSSSSSSWLTSRDKFTEESKTRNIVKIFAICLACSCFLSLIYLGTWQMKDEEKKNQSTAAPLMIEKEKEEKNNGEEKEERAEDIDKLVAKLEGEENDRDEEKEGEEEKEEVKEEEGEGGEEEVVGEKNEEGEEKKGGGQGGERETRQHVRYHLTPDDIFDEDNRKNVLKKRRSAVKQMFRHAWEGYKAAAFGHDEVHPVTNTTNDSWGGFGITLVDTLDTMALMKFDEYLEEAREFVSHINYDKDYDASFFETTIRHLGGLLGAYEMTRDYLYLSKAIDLGERLLASFNSPTGIPYSIINLRTGAGKNHGWTQHNSILSEAGSVQLEFKALSYFTGDRRYKDAAHKVMETLNRLDRPFRGLFPQYINNQIARYESDTVTYGGLSDSFYEYLLKQWIQSGKTDELMKKMYQDAVHDLRNNLIQRTFVKIYNSDDVHPHFYVSQMKGRTPVKIMEHLACFVPGMLALGHHHGIGFTPTHQKPTTPPTSFWENDKEVVLGSMNDLELAKELAHTCVDLYMDQATGLGPESVRFHEEKNKDGWYSIESSVYYLRPETIESLYILYYVTGDPHYQDLGWQIFKGIQQNCRTNVAYSSINDVTKKTVVWSNSMQSFFFSETIKYLYLLFSPLSTLDLESRVLTTEAHPLPVMVASS